MIKYRSDIDGLRALAVIAVVLYHAFPKLIKGGFVGVDIFFVISGYLISGILFRNFEANNFSLYHFYARRVKRIFPALVLVITTSLIFGWFVLTDIEYMQLAKHAKASSLFYTNFILVKESGYFDITSNAKPLMHLWSLAVEEQFYIFWPLLLYFANKKGFNFISICIAIIFLSFLFSITILHKHPIKAFYLPLYRIWELISGALLAYLASNKIETIEKAKKLANHWLNLVIYKNYPLEGKEILRDAASIVGFIINLCTIIFLKKTNSFPGWYAILPVIGTLLILAAGEDSFINKKILSNKACVGIGLISYPLYLWHWPLLSFAFILEGNALEPQVIVGALFASFILAYITYKFFEKPIRSSKDQKFIVLILAAFMLLIGITGYQIDKNRGYKFRQANLMNIISPLPQVDQNFLDLKIHCSAPLSALNSKQFETPFCMANTTKPRFLIVGDSHALAFAYNSALDNKLDIALFTSSGLLPFISYINYNPLHHKREEWMERSEIGNKYINSLVNFYDSVEYVILATRGPLYFTGKGFGAEEQEPSLNGWTIEDKEDNQVGISAQDAFVNGYIEIINLLLSKGKKVIFAIDIPELGIDPKSCLKRAFSLSSKKVASCLVEKNAADERQKEYRELVAKIQQTIPSLIVYDPIQAFCDQDKCYGKKKKVIYYGDYDHLNLEGSKVLIDHFKEWFLKLDKNHE